MKKIFFVKNREVWNQISRDVDRKSVAAVYNLDSFEKRQGDKLPTEISVKGLDKFDPKEVSAIIAMETGETKGNTQYGRSYYRRLSLAVAKTLKRHGIDCTFHQRFSNYAHLSGTFSDIKGDFKNIPTLRLIQKTLQKYPDEFKDKQLDIWFSFWDEPDRAYDLAVALDLPYVFTYCTSYALGKRIVAFPDQESRFDNSTSRLDISSNKTCKAEADKPYVDSHVFWRGSLFVDFTRTCLYELGKQYPQYLKIEDSNHDGEFISMPSQARYKYLIDTRGNAWSGRLQTLLKLKRVVFIVDRPYREWYFNLLNPMEHYVPVKEDLSDLIDKVCYLEQNPYLYEKIASNSRTFADTVLSPERIIFESKELLLRYGTKA